MASEPSASAPQSPRFTRREALALWSAVGLIAGLDPRALPAVLRSMPVGATDEPSITRAAVAAAEEILGLSFTEAERDLMLEGLTEQRAAYAELRAAPVPNDLPPAVGFDPLPPGLATPGLAERTPLGAPGDPVREPLPLTTREVARPAADGELAGLPVAELAELVRTRRVSSAELTELYLGRLERHGPRLECVVTLTHDLARAQARRADDEIAAGRWQGPLHGIPWGAKDLLAVRGYPTTWGSVPYREQVLERDATVVRRLERAGAVLVAKLTLGELAWGDVWFGGMTRNPWNLEQGSSGSSAGSASATVAGLVGFAIGSETLGSIVSPSTRCGATGFRPTFGRVSRHGAMALSWTMDKLGPIARSVEDCALVFHAIHGPDGLDPVVREAPFAWRPLTSLRGVRVGWLRSAFERSEDHPTKPFDDAALATLEALGAELVPVELPGDIPIGPLGVVLDAEAAAAFDELTRSNRDDLMVRQIANAWPNAFRQARLIPAVEYIQANRLRTRLVAAVEETIGDLDAVVSPSFAENLLLTTNLTGHPAAVLPNGFREDGTPVSITFWGRLYADDRVLAVAKAYQDATDFHLRRPPGFA